MAAVLHARAMVAVGALYAASELESARRQRLAWRARTLSPFAPNSLYPNVSQYDKTLSALCAIAVKYRDLSPYMAPHIWLPQRANI